MSAGELAEIIGEGETSDRTIRVRVALMPYATARSLLLEEPTLSSRRQRDAVASRSPSWP